MSCSCIAPMDSVTPIDVIPPIAFIAPGGHIASVSHTEPTAALVINFHISCSFLKASMAPTVSIIDPVLFQSTTHPTTAHILLPSEGV